MQYFGKKHRILRKHAKNKRLSFASAKGLRDKRIRGEYICIYIRERRR